MKIFLITKQRCVPDTELPEDLRAKGEVYQRLNTEIWRTIKEAPNPYPYESLKRTLDYYRRVYAYNAVGERKTLKGYYIRQPLLTATQEKDPECFKREFEKKSTGILPIFAKSANDIHLIEDTLLIFDPKYETESILKYFPEPTEATFEGTFAANIRRNAFS